jgi:hypothetical protein
MPNCLNIVSAGGTVLYSVPLVDPALVRGLRDRFNRPRVPELAFANAFYCPGHRWPARGWVLLGRAGYNQITTLLGASGLYKTNFQLNLDDFFNLQNVTGGSGQPATNGILLQNLALTQARCVTRGLASSPNAIYLVELTDPRGLLSNAWFQAPTTSQYNVISPAYPGQFYSLSTPGGGTPWNWNAMVADLWGQMPVLGAYPGLPITPAGTPEGFVFPGVSCWDALCSVLDLLGLTISVNLTKSAPYGIVSLMGTDAAFTSLQSQYLSSLEEDLEWIDAGAGRVPGKVTIYFHRYNAQYGTEETVRRDALQWASTPLYSVTVTGPSPYSNSPGTHYIWDDFQVSYDVNNLPVAADAATAATIAAERAQQYYNRVTRGTAGYLTQVYAGAINFFTGSLCDGVCWYQREGRLAWRTEVLRGPDQPWPLVQHRED